MICTGPLEPMCPVGGIYKQAKVDMGILRNSSKAPLCVGRYKPLWHSIIIEVELEV